MEYRPVVSSSIADVAYEHSTSTLGIRFRAGGEYLYFSVPERVYEELLAADSVGHYFNHRVRAAAYPYARLS
jgi:hypothetical protein